MSNIQIPYEPRYGVCKSLSSDFVTAAAHTLAWFHYRYDAMLLLAQLPTTYSVWDLNLGVRLK